MPEGIRDDQILAINEALTPNLYTFIPLVSREHRIRIFGSANPTRITGRFAIKGFIMHLVQPVEEGTGLDTIVAPTHDASSEIGFVRDCMILVNKVAPKRESFPLPLAAISRKLATMGLSTASGLVFFSTLSKPRINFASLVMPKVFQNEFKGPKDPEPTEDFATGLAAASFLYLSAQHINSFEQPPEEAP